MPIRIQRKAMLSTYMFELAETKNNYILYNIYTDALVAIQKGKRTLDELLDDESFLAFLYDEFVLIDPNTNPNLVSKYMINKAKYATTNLMITDALTYDCNLRCVYCMQQNTFKDVQELSPAEKEKIWKTLYTITGASSLSVCFFGGEPLLRQRNKCCMSIIFSKEI